MLIQIKFSVVTIVISIQVLIAIVVTFIITSKNNGIRSSFIISSYGMITYFFLKNLFAGPLGEELGWRGFAQRELQKKHSPLKASVIIGFWWGIWHLPIWFTTGCMGVNLIELIKYNSILYLVVAIILIVINQKKVLYRNISKGIKVSNYRVYK